MPPNSFILFVSLPYLIPLLSRSFITTTTPILLTWYYSFIFLCIYPLFPFPHIVSIIPQSKKVTLDKASESIIISLVRMINSEAPFCCEPGFWLVAEELSRVYPHYIHGEAVVAAWKNSKRPARTSSPSFPPLSSATPLPSMSGDTIVRVLRVLSNVALAHVTNIARLTSLPHSIGITPQGNTSSNNSSMRDDDDAAPTSASRYRAGSPGVIPPKDGIEIAEYLLGILCTFSRITSSFSLPLNTSKKATTSSTPSPGDSAAVLQAQIRCLHALSTSLLDPKNPNLDTTPLRASASTSLSASIIRLSSWEDRVIAAALSVLDTFVFGRLQSSELIASVTKHSLPQPPSRITASVVSACLFTIGEVILASDNVALPPSLITTLLAFLPPKLTRAPAALESSSSATPLATASVIAVPSSVRAHAFSALGKLCVKDKDLAKKHVCLSHPTPWQFVALLFGLHSYTCMYLLCLCFFYSLTAFFPLPLPPFCLWLAMLRLLPDHLRIVAPRLCSRT